MIATFFCLALAAIDGDGIACRDGTRLRLAGVNAREMRGNPCPKQRPCPAMSAARSRQVLDGMVRGKALACVRHDVSWGRPVVSCAVGGVDVRCAMLAAGAVARWPEYERRYRLGRC